jgi:hypothetical protein
MNRVIRKKDHFVILIGGNAPWGYYTEIACPFSLGEPSQETKDTFAAVLEAEAVHPRSAETVRTQKRSGMPTTPSSGGKGRCRMGDSMHTLPESPGPMLQTLLIVEENLRWFIEGERHNRIHDIER